VSDCKLQRGAFFDDLRLPSQNPTRIPKSVVPSKGPTQQYVNDILLNAPRDKSKNVLDAFNSIHPKLQFTIEIGGKNLNFLDVMIINNNNILEFDVYQKPTFSGKVLSYLSKHPISQKRSVIISMVDRAFLLSHPKYHIKNLNFIIETFFWVIVIPLTLYLKQFTID